MPANPLPLSERIHRACPCHLNIGVMCEENCRCAPASLRAKSILGDEPCKWEGHAIAGEVERKVLRVTTPAMFALEELSRWPKAAEGRHFVMWSPSVDGLESKPHAVPPEKVEGIFEALLQRINEIAPEARRAMQAYYDIDGVRRKVAALTAKLREAELTGVDFIANERAAKREIKALTAKVEASHVPCCECGINSPEPAQHGFVDPRCVEWRRK